MYPKLMYDNLVLAEYDAKTKQMVYYPIVRKERRPILGDKFAYTKLVDFVEERILPVDRVGIEGELKGMGLEEYYPMEIAKVTNAALMEDGYWVAFNEYQQSHWREHTLRGASGFSEKSYKDI